MADIWTQQLGPLNGSPSASAGIVIIPILCLFVLLFFTRVIYAALVGLSATLIVATVLFGMPVDKAFASALDGALFGAWPICHIVLSAIFLYDLCVSSGNFASVRYTLSSLTSDRRCLALLLAYAFSGFMEGASGFATPIALSISMLIGLGFTRPDAIRVALLGNSVPVVFGGLGVPTLTLATLTKIDPILLAQATSRLMIPFSLLMPWVVVHAVSPDWKSVRQMWPACILTAFVQGGISLLIAQYSGPPLPSLLSMLVTLGALSLLYRVWQPPTILLPGEVTILHDHNNATTATTTTNNSSYTHNHVEAMSDAKATVTSVSLVHPSGASNNTGVVDGATPVDIIIDGVKVDHTHPHAIVVETTPSSKITTTTTTAVTSTTPASPTSSSLSSLSSSPSAPAAGGGGDTSTPVNASVLRTPTPSLSSTTLATTTTITSSTSDSHKHQQRSTHRHLLRSYSVGHAGLSAHTKGAILVRHTRLQHEGVKKLDSSSVATALFPHTSEYLHYREARLQAKNYPVNPVLRAWVIAQKKIRSCFSTKEDHQQEEYERRVRAIMSGTRPTPSSTAAAVATSGKEHATDSASSSPTHAPVEVLVKKNEEEETSSSASSNATSSTTPSPIPAHTPSNAATSKAAKPVDDGHGGGGGPVEPSSIHFDTLHPPTMKQAILGWTPWVIVCILVGIWGSTNVKAGLAAATLNIAIPSVDGEIRRAPSPSTPTKLGALMDAHWKLDLLGATGTCLLIVAIVTSFLYRIPVKDVAAAYIRTVKRMWLSFLTVMCLLSFGYVLRYSGQDTVLGLAAAESGKGYPILGAFMGFIGVALTGSATTSNVLFGGAQIAAAESLGLNPVHMASANTVAGALGHVISASSIVVAAVAAGDSGKNVSVIARSVAPYAGFLLVLMAAWSCLVAYALPDLIPTIA